MSRARRALLLAGFTVAVQQLGQRALVPMAGLRQRAQGRWLRRGGRHRRCAAGFGKASSTKNRPKAATPKADAKTLVFDNVLSPSACLYMHVAASVCYLDLGTTQTSTIYDRKTPPRTPFEQCVKSILDELGDSSQYVQYWWRQFWEYLAVHQDLDEFLFESSNMAQQRPCKKSHVLYLSVGEAVRGPTCVWERADSQTDGYEDFGPMTTVPACRGRLLRFDGELMHGVPKPADAYLPAKHRRPFVPPTNQAELVRSVLLFTTWDESPPMSHVEISEELPDGSRAAWGVSAEHFKDPHDIVRDRSPNLDMFAKITSKPDALCQPFDRWKQAAVRQADSSHSMRTEDGVLVPMEVMMMDADRRGKREVVQLGAPDGLSKALHQSRRVTHFR
eukprot:TRINITY_DN50050_c0_g1_i1.p1 TRINITY_DN50050_c0_g1~~TRINITY_DN50050_c0_g1_i1.p1  ORF type:complete len:397 (-),score=66.72 TRINITY_DN50050_c0_g1_i1:49-1218(-)